MSQCPMRRKDRRIDDAYIQRLLETAEYGVLSTNDGDQPYGTPLSFVMIDGGLYFHCAAEGHKVNNIRKRPRVCFTVVGKTFPVYNKDFSTYFESVVVFGNASEVTDDALKEKALRTLVQKYLPEHSDKADHSIEHYGSRTGVYVITPDVITGKAKL